MDLGDLSGEFDVRLRRGEEMNRRLDHARQMVRALSWKRKFADVSPLIVCLVGGTGVGKSALFNSLVGSHLSAVGATRPHTLRAVAAAPAHMIPSLRSCPFLGDPRLAEILENPSKNNKFPILVDTPDFDSIESSNRDSSRGFFLIADITLFVTSPEKYADEAAGEMMNWALEWGKRMKFVMNKTTPGEAAADFAALVKTFDPGAEPTFVERISPPPDSIPHLRDRPEFARMLHDPDEASIKSSERVNLAGQALAAMREISDFTMRESARLEEVSRSVTAFYDAQTARLDEKLDAVVTTDLQTRIQERLQQLLRKYDILFVPRAMLREYLSSLWDFVGNVFGGKLKEEGPDAETRARNEDLTETRHAARLQPLYSGLSEFNLQVTELVCGAPAHEDLCRIFASTVERFSAEKADELYAGEFPGIEAMLEEEFRKLQGGLSRADEFKLYGSFTAWALIIITAEIVLGGGFTLLDMILNTAVMPFIPKWITHFKILDVLKEIGERIDEAHRKALHKILGLQMQRYLDQIGAVTPAGVGVDEAAALEDALREELAGAAALKPA